MWRFSGNWTEEGTSGIFCRRQHRQLIRLRKPGPVLDCGIAPQPQSPQFPVRAR